MAGLAVVYLFVILVDPWGSLPLALPWPRVPISSNARFSFPALARDPRFDSAVFGTSTSRLLRPALLDPAFGARFANLSMNSATAWEQSRLFGVFVRAHKSPRVVVFGLDYAWCSSQVTELTDRPFPEWMYRDKRWRGYREMLTDYAVQEAANQFAVLVGLKRPTYGADGYTRFVPEDSQYDPVRAAAAFARWSPPDNGPPAPDPPMPALEMLRADLARLPPTTRRVLYFTPIQADWHGTPGGADGQRWAACKAGAARIAADTGAEVLDFTFPNAVTLDRTNYWDPLHARASVTDRVARDLATGQDPGFVRRLAN